MEEKNYTLDDIARELGVSKTTVSRAISGKGRIGQKTKERVWELIEQYDYHPNAAARSLAKRKSYNLALVLPKEYEDTELRFFKECMNGVCEAAAEHRYNVLILMVEGGNPEALKRVLADKKADGVIVTRAMEDSAIQNYLQNSGVPALVIGPCSMPGIHSVDNKNEEASQELTEILLMKGVRKLALFGGDLHHSVTLSRCRGYEKAHEKLGFPVDRKMICTVESYPDALKAVEEVAEAGAQGIICMDDSVTMLALAALRTKGISIPEKMKLASFYDSKLLEYNNPSISSARFDTVRLGRNACLTILKLLGEQCGEELLPSGYQIVLRESTK